MTIVVSCHVGWTCGTDPKVATICRAAEKAGISILGLASWQKGKGRSTYAFRCHDQNLCTQRQSEFRFDGYGAFALHMFRADM